MKYNENISWKNHREGEKEGIGCLKPLKNRHKLPKVRNQHPVKSSISENIFNKVTKPNLFCNLIDSFLSPDISVFLVHQLAYEFCPL